MTELRGAREGRVGKEIIQVQLASCSFPAAKNPIVEMLRQRGGSLGRERGNATEEGGINGGGGIKTDTEGERMCEEVCVYV